MEKNTRKYARKCAIKREVLILIKTGKFAFQDASEELRNDKEVVLAAIMKNGNYIAQNAGKEFSSDKKIMLSVVKFDGRLLE